MLYNINFVISEDKDVFLDSHFLMHVINAISIQTHIRLTAVSQWPWLVSTLHSTVSVVKSDTSEKSISGNSLFY